ncbi:MAG: PQQ-binding-like beta-propeller repeat protein [Nannocystaceae bacterium]
MAGGGLTCACLLSLGCWTQPRPGGGACPEGVECSAEREVADAAERHVEGEGAPAAAAVDGRPWRRGGPGSPTPLDIDGPEAAPEVLWEAPLGAVITGAPTFAAVDDGATAAFVGTHAGRFVGVVVEGPRAGAIAVDVNVPGMIWGTAARASDGALIFGADNDMIYAVDPRAGAITWSQRLGACDPPRALGPEGTRCDPDGGPTIAADGDIFVGADGVYRLDPRGALRWHYPAADIDPRPRHVGAAPLVTLDGGVVVGGQDGAVIALDREGGLRWRVELGPDVDAAPVMLKSGLVVAAADDGRVVAIEPSGETRWTFTAGKDVRAPLALGADDTIYAAGFDGLLYALRPDGALRWSFTAGAAIASAPVVDAAGRVYFGARDDFIYAVDRRGRLQWRVELPEDVDAGLAISDGGVVVVGGDDGVLRALR